MLATSLLLSLSRSGFEKRWLSKDGHMVPQRRQKTYRYPPDLHIIAESSQKAVASSFTWAVSS